MPKDRFVKLQSSGTTSPGAVYFQPGSAKQRAVSISVSHPACPRSADTRGDAGLLWAAPGARQGEIAAWERGEAHTARTWTDTGTRTQG